MPSAPEYTHDGLHKHGASAVPLGPAIQVHAMRDTCYHQVRLTFRFHDYDHAPGTGAWFVISENDLPDIREGIGTKFALFDSQIINVAEQAGVNPKELLKASYRTLFEVGRQMEVRQNPRPIAIPERAAIPDDIMAPPTPEERRIALLELGI